MQLVTLILGIMMSIAGISLMISDLGLIFLILGVIFLVVSFAASRQMVTFLLLPEEVTAMALYVAVEFISGAALALLMIMNIIFEPNHPDWSFGAIAVFGILLIVDSLLLYRRGFKPECQEIRP